MNASNHYQPGRELARGGMGAILEAKDSTLDREVAVKVMLDEATCSPQTRQRFLREALVLARLEHPNIVPIYEMGRDAEGRLFYAMKLVKGRTLQAILRDLKTGDAFTTHHYTLDRLLTIFRKVCDAMAFAHHQHIIHRDLKPENVMVGEFGEVLLMDWGLAKHLDDEAQARTELERAQAAPIEGIQELSDAELAEGAMRALTLDGAVMGSPQYMAPEQAEGRVADIGTHSDIYGLGGILYSILTLNPPVAGRKLVEVLSNVRSGNITPPTHYRPAAANPVKATDGSMTEACAVKGLPHCPDGRVPAALSAVAMRALALDPASRYANVLALAADVEAYQGGFATIAEAAGLLTQLRLFVRRHKAVATLATVTVLLTLGFLAKVVTSERRANLNALEARHRLDELKKTAPIFYAQAQVDFETGKPDLAIEKLGYAIQLDAQAADYHLRRAHYHQTGFRLTDAAEDYRRTLELRPQDASAKTNLTLCEKLLNGGAGTELTQDHKLQILAALRSQKRTLEANLIAAEVAPDLNAGRAAILARLRDARKLAGWKDQRVQALADGTFLINYDDLGPIDFSGLKDLPVSAFKFAGESFSNLNCIAGLPLRELTLEGCSVTDLTALKGMPLEKLSVVPGKHGLKRMSLADLSPLQGSKLRELNLTQTAVKELGPLAGLPLRRLHLGNTSITNLTALARCRELNSLHLNSVVSDLSPLAKLPLEFLDCMNAPITDLGPLRGMPLRTLWLFNTKATDLSPLAECVALESLLLPPKPTDLSPIRKLPKLTAVSFRSTKIGNYNYLPSQKAEEFWRDYDAKQPSAPK